MESYFESNENKLVNMKKFLFSFLILSLLTPLSAVAQATVVIPNPLKCKDIPCVVAAIGDLIFYVGLALVTLMIVIGGLMLIIAAGDPNKVATAKRLFFWTGIGAAVIILARAISGVIKYILGGG